jgi:hypothetical protein
VQRGSICTGGTTCGSDRNLLDFIDATIDDHGRIEVAYADGCINTCVTDPSETSGAGPADAQAAYATIARQSSGKTLFAQYDPQPNLTLTSLNVSRKKGSYTANVQVTNTGDTAIGAFDTQVTDNGQQVGFTRGTSLAAGKSTTLTYTWKASGTSQTVTAVVDPQNAIAESNESDNKAQQVVSQ